jgi:integrase
MPVILYAEQLLALLKAYDDRVKIWPVDQRVGECPQQDRKRETVDAIAAARKHRVLGSMGGQRHGEIAALQRKSVDLDRAQLAVVASIEQTKAGCREKEVKGSRCRTIAMPALLVDELRRHFLSQAEQMLRLGMRPDGETLVVMNEDGTGIQPRSLTHAVSKFMKQLGSKVRLHGLRPRHASHLLAANVHPKIVQERLGPFEHRDHHGHLQPRHAEHAGRCDREGRRRIQGRAESVRQLNG